MRKFLHRTVALLAIACLASCTTYVGHKLDKSGALPPSSTGIPYTMTKPEYTVSITPNAEDPSKAVYTLSMKDVPDPNHRYTLALDPSLFTDGKFTMKFGEYGNLTDANATTSSRVVATLKAVGKAAAQFKLFDATQRDELDKFLSYVAANRKCQAGAPRSAGASISTTITDLYEKGEAEKEGTGVERAIDSYFYRTPAEQDCLETVKAALDGNAPIASIVAIQTSTVAARGSVTEVINSLTPSGSLTTTSISEIRDIVKAVEGWSKAKDAASIDRAADYAGKYRFVRYLDMYLTRARNQANAELAHDRVKALAKSFALPRDVWRARYVKWLGTEIEKEKFRKDLDPQAGTTTYATITAHEKTRAELVGGRPILQRIQNLDTLLQQVHITRNPTDGSVRIAADEHIKLREERDRLDIQLKALIASIISSDAKGGDKAKVKARPDEEVRLANRKFINDVNDNLPIFFTKLPEFVLVLEPQPSPMFADAPVRKGAQK